MKYLFVAIIYVFSNFIIAQNPPVFVPVDYQNANWTTGPTQNIFDAQGHEVLVLRRAYFWANSESNNCPHGPWAKIYVDVYNPILLQALSFEYIQNNPSEISPYIMDGENLKGTKLPGPIYFAEEDCLFNFEHAYSEWIDGPWGCFYSNIGVIDWTETDKISVSIIISEGDGQLGPFGSEDDILGGMLINKNMPGIIHIPCPGYGWVELENIIVPNNLEPTVDVGQFYWYYDWDGSYPSNAQLEPQTNYDQYQPFANGSIDDMEAFFPENKIIGLMGGKFPAGILNKPMIYRASDVPAVFGE